MIHNYTDVYSRVVLKPLEAEDIEPLRLLRNKPQNRKWFIYSDEISAEEQIKWYDKYKCIKKDIMFSIFLNKKPTRFIGAVALYNIDLDNLTAEFGRIIIDTESINEKGLGLDATNCAIKIGFEQLNLNTIYLEVFSDNGRAIKTYQRAGFTKVSEDNNRNIITMKIEKNKN